jgi:phytoene synthase
MASSAVVIPPVVERKQVRSSAVVFPPAVEPLSWDVLLDVTGKASPEAPVETLPTQNAEAVEESYEMCGEVAESASKTFYTATSLMRPAARKHVWAIYAWCRRTDDIVDSQLAWQNPDMLEGQLKNWERRLDNIWNQKPYDTLDLAMADTVRAYPTLDIRPFRDMIDGMVMDVPGHALSKTRYETFKELEVYCYRVAGTVGMMTLPILGTADGFTEEQAREPAKALGIALQLTNILRDVGEDLQRGRIYLPLDELLQFGLTEDDLFSRKVTEKYKTFLKFQIARARDYYAEATRGIPMLAPDARFAVRASLDLYAGILDKIEENDYDNFHKRAYTSKLEKLRILPGSWMKSVMPGKGASLADPTLSLASSPHNAVGRSEVSVGAAAMVGAVMGGVVAVVAVARRRHRPTCSAEPLLG